MITMDLSYKMHCVLLLLSTSCRGVELKVIPIIFSMIRMHLSSTLCIRHFFPAIIYQLPWIGLELKVIPIIFAVVSAILAIYSNFNVILMEGGVGRNGSTVAVSGNDYVIRWKGLKKRKLSSKILITAIFNSVENKFKPLETKFKRPLTALI